MHHRHKLELHSFRQVEPLTVQSSPTSDSTNSQARKQKKSNILPVFLTRWSNHDRTELCQTHDPMLTELTNDEVVLATSLASLRPHKEKLSSVVEAFIKLLCSNISSSAQSPDYTLHSRWDEYITNSRTAGWERQVWQRSTCHHSQHGHWLHFTSIEHYKHFLSLTKLCINMIQKSFTSQPVYFSLNCLHGYWHKSDLLRSQFCSYLSLLISGCT